jgi:hypothetical protein
MASFGFAKSRCRTSNLDGTSSPINGDYGYEAGAGLFNVFWSLIRDIRYNGVPVVRSTCDVWTSQAPGSVLALAWLSRRSMSTRLSGPTPIMYCVPKTCRGAQMSEARQVTQEFMYTFGPDAHSSGRAP